MKDNDNGQKKSDSILSLSHFNTKIGPHLLDLSQGTFLSDEYKNKQDRARSISSIGVGPCDAFAANSFKLGCKTVITILANSKNTIGGVYFKVKSKRLIDKLKDLSKYADEVEDSGKFRIALIEEIRELIGKDIVIQPGAIDKFIDQYTGHFGLKNKPSI